jgi:hypothetical protein
MSEDARRQRIRERIVAGRLPPGPCLVVWLGAGQGQRCGVCSRRIAGREASVEWEPAEGRCLPLHFECFRVWHEVAAESASGLAGPSAGRPLPGPAAGEPTPGHGAGSPGDWPGGSRERRPGGGARPAMRDAPAKAPPA